MTQRDHNRVRVRDCLALGGATLVGGLVLVAMVYAAGNLSLPNWLFAVLPVLYLVVIAAGLIVSVGAHHGDRIADAALARRRAEQELAARHATRPAGSVSRFPRRGDVS